MNYLPKSDVVFSVMFLNKTLCEKTLQAVLGEEIELVDTINEYKNNLRLAVKNSIYFDVRTCATDGRIITLDLQRRYMKDRIRNRTIYYACREVAAQTVERGKYEELKNVIVTFILTEAPKSSTSANRKVQLFDSNTSEKYSELFTIYEINIRHIGAENSLEMRVLKDFFELDSQDAYDVFIESYKSTQLGSLLINAYAAAISDTSLLQQLGEEEKFVYKLTEEERIMERQEGIEEGIEKVAINLLKKNVALDTIVESTGLTIEQINKLSENIRKRTL